MRGCVTFIYVDNFVIAGVQVNVKPSVRTIGVQCLLTLRDIGVQCSLAGSPTTSLYMLSLQAPYHQIALSLNLNDKKQQTMIHQLIPFEMTHHRKCVSMVVYINNIIVCIAISFYYYYNNYIGKTQPHRLLLKQTPHHATLFLSQPFSYSL